MSTVFSVIAFFVISGAILCVASRTARLSVGFASLFAVPVGTWCIAPRFLRVHAFHPSAVSEWAVLLLFFWATFSIVGAVLGLLMVWPVTMYGVRATREAATRVAAIWAAVALPFGYVGLSVLVEFGFFVRLPAIGGELRAVLLAAAAASVVSGLVVAAVLRRSSSARALIAGVAIAAIAGFAALVLRTGPGRRTESEALPPLAVSSAAAARPLLVIGLDGGNWRTIEPLLAAHRLPTIERLIGEGVRGNVEAPWPPYWSTPAWAAIVTGHVVDAAGVTSDMTAVAPGLSRFELPLQVDLALNPMMLVELVLSHTGVIEPGPAPRSSLPLPPIWERLTAAGVPNAVVHFPFTYPAANQSAFVVSDRTVTDLWEMMGVKPGARDRVVSPKSAADSLLAWFRPGAPIDAHQIDSILVKPNWPKPADAIVDPTQTVRAVLDTSQRMFGVTQQIIQRDPDLRAVFFYTPDFDKICHALWQYRFPDDFTENRPSPADVAALGPVLDRYLEYLDQEFARLIAAFPTTPNVLLLSDHGEESTTQVTIWRGWHSKQGIFVAGGPDVEAQSAAVEVSYEEIAPTVLELLKVERPSDLAGHSVVVNPQR